jgi:outer membrane protein assembly factor BamB
MGPPARPARRNQHLGRQWRPAYRWALSGAIAAIVLALITATAFLRADGDTAGDEVDLSQPVVSLLWQVSTGRPATSAPTITGTGVFLGGTDGAIRGFSQTDGRPMWTFRAASGESVYVRGSADGVVYATTGGGAIVAVDADTGKKLWGRTTETTFNAPPAIGKVRVFAAGGDSNVYSYRTSGSSRRRGWTGGETLTSPTVIKDAAIVASADERLYVLPGGYVQRKPRIGRPAGGPVAVGDAACTPLADGSVRCVRTTDGEALPPITLPGTKLSAPASDGNLLFAAGANGAVGAWDPETGKRQWLVPPERPGTGPGHLVRHKGSVVVTYPDGRLIGLDAAAGGLLWKVTLPDQFDAAPRINETATYVVGRTGTLYALQTPGSASASAESATPSRTPTFTTSPPRTKPRPRGNPPNPTTIEPSEGVTSPPPEPTTAPPTPTAQLPGFDRP